MRNLIFILLLVGCSSKRPKAGFYRSIYDKNFFSARFTLDENGIAIGQPNSKIELKEGDTIMFQRGAYKVSFYRVPDNETAPKNRITSGSGPFRIWWDKFSDSAIDKIDTNGYISYLPTFQP